MKYTVRRNKLDSTGVLLVVCTMVFFSTAAGLVARTYEGPRAEVVWAESDGIRHEIFYSAYGGGDWSTPVMVTDDYYDNMYPVVDRDDTGRTWVIWSAYHDKSMELRYSIHSDNEWERSKTIPVSTGTNTAPSFVFDSDNTLWLVWAANDGSNDDDIFYITGKDGQWSEPERLHADNDVPDALPVIVENADNLPVVSWRRLVRGEYIVLQSSWDGSSWTEPSTIDERDEDQQDDETGDLIPMPQFIEQGGLVFFRIY